MATYTRIPLKERYLIAQHLQQGSAISYGARVLRRTKSSLSTEVRRCGMSPATYCPKRANIDAEGCKRKTIPIKRGGIKNIVSIGERPTSVEDREEPGHWEGDLVIGKKGLGAMGILVERSSRYVILVPPRAKNSAHVTEAFAKALAGLPKHMLKSLTYDRGTEMAQHEEFTNQTGMPVFFANPGCPWQRGSNENTNGLLREFFPNGSPLDECSPAQTEYVQQLLNRRPRKTVGYRTPERLMEKFSQDSELKLSMVI